MSSLNDQKYTLFLNILDNQVVSDEDIPSLTIDLYLTLLSLNNNNYKDEIMEATLEIIEDYLRKVNNLKVKIQLKRKPEEIDKLSKEILNIYEENKLLIDKYNPSSIDIITTINSKDTKALTSLIDVQTKEKMERVHNKEYYDNLRNKIIANLPIKNYTLDDNNIIINLENESVTIPINAFYKVFDYLLNIDSYSQPLINTKTNRLHTILIADIIKTILKITEKTISSKVAIPLVLTNLLSSNIAFYEEIDTHNFNIDNIKITDLYKEADKNNISNIDTHPSWRKVTISNEFLYNKLTTIIKKGTYYFQDNLFVLENIENNTSDFKVSIDEENVISFLKDNLEYLYNKNNKKIV